MKAGYDSKISVLKTTMFVKIRWKVLKRDFLYKFFHPRFDLVIIKREIEIGDPGHHDNPYYYHVNKQILLADQCNYLLIDNLFFRRDIFLLNKTMFFTVIFFLLIPISNFFFISFILRFLRSFSFTGFKFFNFVLEFSFHFNFFFFFRFLAFQFYE
ncbi:hypothetical protein RclHR1_22320002 [Rhizophagus clarus]|uniref:Uncharacterized protein n=1 Tax=Rhizophagus clarus TaxID=94130 RepID=A0A2Z6R7S8_9GLOM|nr:hypothetical protein RclHR1_22320002 [Rhizophagus clarus]